MNNDQKSKFSEIIFCFLGVILAYNLLFLYTRVSTSPHKLAFPIYLKSIKMLLAQQKIRILRYLADFLPNLKNIIHGIRPYSIWLIHWQRKHKRIINKIYQWSTFGILNGNGESAQKIWINSTKMAEFIANDMNFSWC